mgnify:CR=1 FL=1
MENKENRNVVLASGGTGGHIFPAEALALELKSRGISCALITDERYEKYVGHLQQFDAYTIRTGTLSGNLLKKLKNVINIMIGFYQAWVLLKQLKPKVVVGFGGYPSFPTMYVAVKMGIKTVIHEQNSLLGHTNQFLSGMVDVIATSFKDMTGLDKQYQHKVNIVGNPVRPSIAALRDMPFPTLSDEGVLRILVIGGSQGASIFSDVVPDAIALLPQELRSRIRVDQQCRQNDLDKTRAKYKEIGVSADLASFFTDMPLRLASTHLLITRSGATSLSEITVAGRPAIMVPYPHAKDNHQMVNATALEDVGGGWVIPQEAFTPETLSAKIETFLKLPSTVIDAAKNAKEAGLPDANKDLANIIQKFLE